MKFICEFVTSVNLSKIMNRLGNNSPAPRPQSESPALTQRCLLGKAHAHVISMTMRCSEPAAGERGVCPIPLGVFRGPRPRRGCRSWTNGEWTTCSGSASTLLCTEWAQTGFYVGRERGRERSLETGEAVSPASALERGGRVRLWAGLAPLGAPASAAVSTREAAGPRF